MKSIIKLIPRIGHAEAIKVDGLTSVSKMNQYWDDFAMYSNVHWGKLRVMTPKGTKIAYNDEYVVKDQNGFYVMSESQLNEKYIKE